MFCEKIWSFLISCKKYFENKTVLLVTEYSTLFCIYVAAMKVKFSPRVRSENSET